MLNKEMALINVDTLGDRLADALRAGHIWPAFQPIVDLKTGVLRSFEILARWTDPLLGPISPLVFIPQLEKSEQIDRLTSFLLQAACNVAARWSGNFSLAVNLAPGQLQKTECARWLSETVGKTNFPLTRVQVEVTESSLFVDEEKAFATLTQLDALGVRIAIDDFGTGYSSLARLQAFPFHKLKIDACFIRDIDLLRSKRRIAAAIIGLGQSLGMTVVAEGVETEAEAEILRELGCDFGQGWLFGKPMPAKSASVYATALLDRMVLETPTMDASPFQQLHQLRTLYKQAPVGLAYLDMSYRHVHANDRFAAIHGLTGNQLAGKSIYELMDGELLATVEEALAETLSSETAVKRQYVFNGRDVLVFSSRVADVGDDLIGFSVVAIDTTEQMEAIRRLEESEDHFRQATALHLDIVWAALPDGTVNYIGPTIEDISDETLRTRIERWYQKMHPEDHLRVRQEWLAWIPTGRPFEAEFRIKDSSGKYRWMRSRARPNVDNFGSITRWYGIITDIDDLKELQQELTKRSKKPEP